MPTTSRSTARSSRCSGDCEGDHPRPDRDEVAKDVPGLLELSAGDSLVRRVREQRIAGAEVGGRNASAGEAGDVRPPELGTHLELVAPDEGGEQRMVEPWPRR